MLALIGLMVRQGIAAAVGISVALGLALLFTAATEDLLLSLPIAIRWGLFSFAVLVLGFEVPSIRQHLRHRAHLVSEAGGATGRGLEQRWLGCLPMTLTAMVTVVALVVRWMWTGGQAGVLLAIPLYAGLLHAAGWLVFASARSVRLWWATRSISTARQTPSAFPLLAAAEVTTVALLMFVRLPHVTVLKVLLIAWLTHLQASLEPQNQFTEVLLELGPDDSLDEVPYLSDFGTVSAATPAATRRESAEAAQTVVVRAPTVNALLLMLVVVGDNENFVHMELNENIQAERLPSGGACPRGSGLTRDPLSGGQVVLRDSGAASVLLRALLWPPVPMRLAVIDTGVDGTHEDLRDVMEGRFGPDPHGHGTAMAGIAAAVGNNGVGMASLNDRGRFVAVRDYPALQATGGNVDDIADAIYQAVDDRADVILMSFGARGKAPKLVQDAIHYALRNDVFVVTAAGNHGPEGRASDQWPANVPGVLVVTALDQGAYASFSNRAGPGSVGAPGKGICAPVAGGGYRETDGTSAAAAFVAGALARRKAQCRESAGDTLKALQQATWQATAYDPPQLRVDKLLERCARF